MRIRINCRFIRNNTFHNDPLNFFHILDIFNKPEILDLFWVGASGIFPA